MLPHHNAILFMLPVFYIGIVSAERSVFPENGYYSYHPAYDHDLPPNRPLPSKIPFGLPIGGYSAEGRGPPFGLVAFYIEAYGHRFDFNNPWNLFLLKQLIRISSEITSKFVPVDNSLVSKFVTLDNSLLSKLVSLDSGLISKFIPVDNSLMDGPLIWMK